MHQEHLLKNMAEFTQWGGRHWTDLCRYAFSTVRDWEDKRVLEIGFRSGKMSSLFAQLGATVMAVETDATTVPKAQEELRRCGVESKVSLLHYDGDLTRCRDLRGRQFDVVFSKSVLVLLCDGLPQYLRALDSVLAPGGICIFLENGQGGRISALMRKLRWRNWQPPPHIRYFTRRQLDVISEVFRIREVKTSHFPPIYLVIAEKK